jgi:hypothetical protein
MYTTPRHAASGDLAPDVDTTSFRLKLAAVPRRLTTTTGRRRRRPGSRQVRMRTQTRGHRRVGRRAREVAGAGEEPPGAGCRRSAWGCRGHMPVRESGKGRRIRGSGGHETAEGRLYREIKRKRWSRSWDWDKFSKIWKIICLFTLTKNSYILHTTKWWYNPP